MWRRFAALGAIGVALVLVGPTTAGATLPATNGPLIAFLSDAVCGCENALWTIQPNGSGAQERLSLNEINPGLSFSPDGSLLALSATISFQAQLFLVSVEPSPTTRALTQDELGNATDPTWAPDGRRIAFSLDSSIAIINSDGSGVHTIGPGSTPSWSPDGRRIAFSLNGAIWSMTPDGRGLRQLTQSTSDATPDWSPDGSRIIFVRDGSVWSVSSIGLALQRLTASTNNFWPRWSPDGTKILVTKCCEPGFKQCDADLPGVYEWEVYVMNANGTGLRRLTFTCAMAPPNQQGGIPNGSFSAAWQPVR